eukprot:7298384-Prymnesium_polylepis.1
MVFSDPRATALNDAQLPATALAMHTTHQVDPTVPAQMFESTAMGFVLSKDTIATTILPHVECGEDRQDARGRDALWTLEPSGHTSGVFGCRRTSLWCRGSADFVTPSPEARDTQR